MMHTFFEFQLKVGGVLAVGVLIYLLFLSRDNSFQRNRFWLLGCLIVPWIVPLMAMPVWLKQLLIEEKQPAQSFVITQYITEPANTIIEAPKMNLITWENGLWLLSILVAMVLLVRLVIACLSVLKLKRKSHLSSYSGLRLRLFNNVSIVPFSFFRTIYAPKEMEKSDDYQLILEHESTHCKQLHSIDIMMAELVLLLLWWNPFAWWLRKLIAQNHEYCVDNSMLKKVDEPSRYQYLLVNLLSGNSSLQLVNSFNGSFTKKRIVMMNKNKSNHIINKLKIVPVLGVLLLAVSAFTNPDLTKDSFSNEGVSLAGLIDRVEVGDSLSEETEEVITVMGIAARDSVVLDPNHKLQLYGSPSVKVAKGGKNTLVIIDNKEESVEVLNSLEPSKIESVTVLRDAVAIEKYGKKAKDGVVIVHKKDGNNVEVISDVAKDAMGAKVVQIKSINSDNNEALVLLNGEKISMDEFKKLDQGTIKCIEVLKDHTATESFGAEGKHGVIKVIQYTEGEKEFEEKQSSLLLYNQTPNSLRMVKTGRPFNTLDLGGKNPTYIVEGKEMSASEFSNIKAEDIKSINVLKDASAIEKYGTKGKDGVIEVILKDENSDSEPDQTDDVKTIKATKRSFKFSTKGIEGMQGNPLVFIDGEKSSVSELHKEAGSRIKTIDVIKGERAIAEYGEGAKDGVILVTLHSSLEKALKSANQLIYDDRIPSNTTGRKFKMTLSKSKDQMFLIDGKEATYEEVNKLDPEKIERIDITKDPELLKEFENVPKMGVVRITLKK